MSYFRELPDLEYESPFANRISSSSYVQAKNIFRRMKIRDDLQNVFTLFNKYEIREGARPDTVAEDLYGKSDLDWVVLLSANITNVRDQWPLSSKDLYEYTVSKYGLENINKDHHYETKEIKDSDGNLILSKGLVVDKDFSIRFKNGGIYVERSNITTTISNYVYEVRENQKKETIYLLKPSYLQQFLNDMRSEMIYGNSSQYVDKSLIRTQNTRLS